MTPLEIDKALCDIAMSIVDECKERIELADKTNRTEIRALKIEEGMYTMAPRAGLLAYTTGSRESVLETRRTKVIPVILPRYPEIKVLYDELTENEKAVFIAAMQAEIFMRHSYYELYLNDLRRAKETGDTEREFELSIKVGATRRMFRAWEEWRKENGIFPGIFKEEN